MRRALLLFFSLLVCTNLFSQQLSLQELNSIERDRVLRSAQKYIQGKPITVTAVRAGRSMGGIHDYYSEGTYWWPNPSDPNGPYIRKDGISNPENFEAHHKALQRLSIHEAGLTAAYVLTMDTAYASKAAEHLRAWFVHAETRMNPNFLYAQAIKGIVTGRGIGIIDAIHFIEVVKSILVLEEKKYFSSAEVAPMRAWFREFLGWITTHPYGIAERGNGNNHSTWWAAQVAMYATFVGDESQRTFCRSFYRDTLLATQMAANGSFPEELKRTKPYSYSLFNIEGMATLCEILTDAKTNMWTMTTQDGRGIQRGFDFIMPYIRDKSTWPFPKDVAHFDELPVRMQSVLFAGKALKNNDYTEAWKKLNADYTDEELIRTYPIRQPVLWWN
jgi:hypothetical protein